MTEWTVDPSRLRPATLVPPLSKSDALRALVLAHLLEEPALRAFTDAGVASLAADVQSLAAGLARLRAAGKQTVTLDCGDGGAPFRFLLGQVAASPGVHARFTGTVRLGERPHRALFDALRDTLGLGGLRLTEGDPWPVDLVAPASTREPVFRVDGTASSQYASSLLLAAAAMVRREKRAWTVELVGATTSAGYLDLTLAWLARVGFRVEREGDRVTLASWTRPRTWPVVPGDWSSVGYLLPIAWRAKGAVAHVDLGAAHPDRAVMTVLERAGLRVTVNTQHEARVTGSLLRGLVASAAECPDLVPTLAAVACVAPGVSTFTDVEVLRHKESDRLEGLRELVSAAGGRATVSDGAVRIEPPTRVREGFVVRGHRDHRRVMAAATLAVLSGVRARVSDPESVAKSFPGFWQQLASAGVVAAP